ncbi:hypothetical protein QE152_g24316 [Popillia japonica]|uniref:Uncharacterized protein n=1 Tax=Popillia japonica TaxID=7064 RepID=A0AAW1KFB6_POPJA
MVAFIRGQYCLPVFLLIVLWNELGLSDSSNRELIPTQLVRAATSINMVAFIRGQYCLPVFLLIVLWNELGLSDSSNRELIPTQLVRAARSFVTKFLESFPSLNLNQIAIKILQVKYKNFITNLPPICS